MLLGWHAMDVCYSSGSIVLPGAASAALLQVRHTEGLIYALHSRYAIRC